MMKVIKSKRLANYLTEKGFKIEKIDIDKANPAYLIFLFKNTSELGEALKIWTSIDKYIYR